MPSNKPVVESWHGYKIDADNAELVILGGNFGTVVGSVKLNIQGAGVVKAVVKRWTDTAIIVAAPVDVTVQRVHVYTIDSRGKEKQAAQSPAGETRNTNGAAPAWAVTAVDDAVDYITVEGTGLDDVVDVVLYDSAVPVQLFDASFLLDGADLLVDWPAAFVSPIKKLRLSDADGNHVSELDGGPAGLTPDPNGVILDTAVQQSGQYAVLSLIGSGFGPIEGEVRLTKAGGHPLLVPVLSNGWSDSVVQVVVDAGASYSAVELTRDDGEIATVDAGVEFPISITPVQDITATYDPVTDVLTYTSLSGVFSNGFLNVDRIVYTTLESFQPWALSSNEIEFVSAYELRVANADALTLGVTLVQAVFQLNGTGEVVGTWVGNLGPIVSDVTFDVTVNTGTDRILVEASRAFFSSVANQGNQPYAIQMTVDGVLYILPPGLNSGNWNEIDSTHIEIFDAAAWGAVITDMDFFSTGAVLTFLAGWDGSVPTT